MSSLALMEYDMSSGGRWVRPEKSAGSLYAEACWTQFYFKGHMGSWKGFKLGTHFQSILWAAICGGLGSQSKGRDISERLLHRFVRDGDTPMACPTKSSLDKPLGHCGPHLVLSMQVGSLCTVINLQRDLWERHGR